MSQKIFTSCKCFITFVIYMKYKVAAKQKRVKFIEGVEDLCL